MNKVLMTLIFLSTLLFLSCSSQKKSREPFDSLKTSPVVFEVPSKWYEIREDFEGYKTKPTHRSRIEFHTDGTFIQYLPNEITLTRNNKWELNESSIFFSMSNGATTQTGELITSDLIRGTGKNRNYSWSFELHRVDEFLANDGIVPYTYSETELQGIKALKDFISDITISLYNEDHTSNIYADAQNFIHNYGQPKRIEVFEDVDYIKRIRHHLHYEQFVFVFSQVIEFFWDEKEWLSYTLFGGFNTTEDASFDNGIHIGMTEEDFWGTFGLDKNMPKQRPHFSHTSNMNIETGTYERTYGFSTNGWSFWFYFDNSILLKMQWDHR